MVLRYAFAALIGALLCAQSASALSCAQPELATTMEEAKASDTVYYILVGKFVSEPIITNPGGPITHVWPPRQGRAALVRSTFEGYSLTDDPRHDVPLSNFSVDIQTSCAGPWCSSAPSNDQTQIAFVEARQGQAPLLRVSPCTDKIFALRRDFDQVSQLRECFNGPCFVGLSVDGY